MFYTRIPEIQNVSPENPLGDLVVDPADDFAPSSFDSLTTDDWHIHQDFWFTGLGNLNSELVYGFEEGVPLEDTVSRLEEIGFKIKRITKLGFLTNRRSP